MESFLKVVSADIMSLIVTQGGRQQCNSCTWTGTTRLPSNVNGVWQLVTMPLFVHSPKYAKTKTKVKQDLEPVCSARHTDRCTVRSDLGWRSAETGEAWRIRVVLVLRDTPQPSETYVLYSIMSGIHIFLDDNRMLLTPPKSAGSHFKYSSSQRCKKERIIIRKLSFIKR